MAEEKHGDFIKKFNSYLNPHTSFFQNMKGHHSKQLKPCLYMVQNYSFQFEIDIGEKWTFTEILFVCLFHQQNIYQL